MSELKNAVGSALRSIPVDTRDYKVLGVIGVLAMLAGQVQNILQTYLPGVSAVPYFDDLLVVLMFLVAATRILRAPGLPTIILALWFFVLTFALLATTAYTTFGFDTSFFVYRQVAIPALMIFTGMVMTKREWGIICRATVVLAMVNVAYVFLEMFIYRPFDPAPLAEANGSFIDANGNPGTYRGNALFGGASVVRAGGLLLNPPTMGIFFAAAAIIIFYTKSMKYRWPMLIALAGALYLTNSRAGMLIAIIGIIVPTVASLFGAWFSIAVLSLAAVPFALEIATQAGSARHSDGLIQGFLDAFAFPLGRGFGYIGNHRPEEITDGAGESLLGIAFSAGGIVTVLIILMLVVVYVSQIGRRPEVWESAMGLGAVVAALFAETASALNGTIPIWLAAGVALSIHHRLKHDPEFAREFAVERPRLVEFRSRRKAPDENAGQKV